MSTTDATQSVDGGKAENDRQEYRPRLSRLAYSIDQRILSLQKRILQDQPSARADLAKLRHAAERAPGEVPAVWDLTAVDPEKYADGTPRLGRVEDQPTPEEVAAHTVMTLYAVHQQSRQQGMHRPGRGLGYAARELIGSGNEEQTSKRARFNALVTSSTAAELRRHLRTFVSLLRAEEIPLDYAMLADDLISFQYPDGPKRVRLRWSRQYYRIPQDDTSASLNTSDNAHNGEQES